MWFAPKKERLFGGMMLLKKRSPVLGGILNLNFVQVLTVFEI